MKNQSETSKTGREKKRYEFFKAVVEKEKAYGVLVAHQQDDVIETYLMQKERANFVKNYGISQENEIFGVKIIRPLLAYSKQQLKDYDVGNNIPFSIDESNLTDHYRRNKIRHSIVEKLSKEERTKILEEIFNFSQTQVVPKTMFSKNEFEKLSYEDIVLILDFYMQKTAEHRDLSEKFINEIKEAFKTKPNLRYKITKSIWLEHDYEDVFIVNASKVFGYSFEVNFKGNNEFIDVDFSNGAVDRGITKSPEKLFVRNCSKNDELIIRNYASKINRLFIDWKMPLFLREVWPGIYDENGQLIYVPRYRKNFKDEHTSKFKINTEYFLEF